MVPRDIKDSRLPTGAPRLKPITFWKTETIGNDFVLLHADDLHGLDLSEFAIQLCQRKFGIGSDGLLVLSPTSYGIELRMFNPDGTEDFCGNGLRCAGFHAFRQDWVRHNFETLHGGQRIPTSVTSDGAVTVTLPPASFAAEDIPVATRGEFIDQVVCGVRGTAVSTGSAHFIAQVDELPQDEEFFATSPLIETNPLFPDRISVMYTKVVSPGHLKLRIWERGAGETLGCGTGSAAAAVVWARAAGTAGEVRVSNPGGDLIVTLDDWHSPIKSTSRPCEVFTGIVEQRLIAHCSKAKLV